MMHSVFGSAGVPTSAAGKDAFAREREALFASHALTHRTLQDALVAINQNREDEAARLVAGHLDQNPDDVDGLSLLGGLAWRAGQYERAESCFARCVERVPEVDAFRFNHALALRQLNQFDKALEEAELLLKRNPHSVLFRDLVACTLRMMERHSEAIVHYQQLADEHPDVAEVWLGYGDFLRGMGRTDECVAAYRKAIALNPLLARAYWSLSDVKTFRFSEAEIDGMKTLLAGRNLSAGERADLHFALGKAYDDARVHAQAFENYAKANALKALDSRFDRNRLPNHFERCRRTFTHEFFGTRGDYGCEAPDPVFIVGMPRSGSTLIEQILASHSAIEGLGELADFGLVVSRYALAPDENSHADYAQAVRSVDANASRSMGEAYLALTRVRRRLERPFFTDKMPRNFNHIGLIHLTLPNAKIIDARRHPLDCGWSCFKSAFPGGFFAHRLSDLGQHYASYVSLMAHFDKVLPGKIYRLIYEKLVADPESEVRRLFGWLGIPFESQCLRFYETDRVVQTLSSEQVRRPIYASGTGQWKDYEPWLGPLKAALGPVLDDYPDVRQPAA